jgi:uncharacterized protein YecE (DUF72 family)
MAPVGIAAMPSLHLGTSGYSFKDWVGPFYPPGLRPAEHLPFYARRFDCVEVNVSYYRVPDARLFAGMERRTPPGFRFVVKLHGDITHRGRLEADLVRAFRDAVVPLQAAGKLHGWLAQFPWGFRNSVENRAWLVDLRRQFPDTPLFVEFRNSGWIEEPVFDFMRQHALSYVSVDEPRLRGLVPPLARATTEAGYVRLHGRNARRWYADREVPARPEAAAAAAEPPPRTSREQGALRYDYLYNETELREWAEKIKQLVQETRQTYVFFNNCHAGQAPVNAQAMKDLLQQLG